VNYFKKSLFLPHNIGFQYRNFNEFLTGLGLERLDLVKITGKSERSIRRYCNENSAPQWLYLVAFCAAGYLLSDTWSGWHIHPINEGLIKTGSPACKNDSIKPSQINAWSHLHQHNRCLDLKLNDLTRENDFMRKKLLIVDHKKLVPKNVIPFNKSISYEMISKQLQYGVLKNA